VVAVSVFPARLAGGEPLGFQCLFDAGDGGSLLAGHCFGLSCVLS